MHLKPLKLEEAVDFYSQRLSALTPGFAGFGTRRAWQLLPHRYAGLHAATLEGAVSWRDRRRARRAAPRARAPGVDL